MPNEVFNSIFDGSLFLTLQTSQYKLSDRPSTRLLFSRLSQKGIIKIQKKDATERECFTGYLLQDVSCRRSDTKVKASHLCIKNLGLDTVSPLSLCKIYLGFYPNLVPALNAWHRDADTPERDHSGAALGRFALPHVSHAFDRPGSSPIPNIAIDRNYTDALEV
uniref:Uncharacterized protein n=1 Tax=Moniliophthora roreri TaxID=221103 RepID=A0A0W0GBE6_MONRR